MLARHAATASTRSTRSTWPRSARAARPAPASTTGPSRAPALDWRDGGWAAAAGGGSGRELCWFPDPVGAEDCYRAALPDALLLVPAFPGVERVTARMAATRRDRLTARLPMLRPPHPEGGPGAVRVEVRGRRGRGRDVRVLGAMDRPAVAAGAVAALAAVGAAQGRLARAGAAGLAELVDPVRSSRAAPGAGVKAAVFRGCGLGASLIARSSPLRCGHRRSACGQTLYSGRFGTYSARTSPTKFAP